MADAGSLRCDDCGGVGFYDGDDGFFYCCSCGFQSQDLFDTQLQADGALQNTLYSKTLNLQSQSHADHVLAPAPKPEPSMTYSTDGQQLFSFLDGDEASVPVDFGGEDREGAGQKDAEAVASAIRGRYVLGLQVMLKKQCEGLVEGFGVCPVICGVAGPLWMRFVVASGVFREGWADEAILDSEAYYRSQHLDKEAEQGCGIAKNAAELQNLYGKRAAVIWLRSLKKKLPLGSSLAICFLACHIARQAVLPTDIIKWAREGKLFYLAAFNDIEKYIGSPPKACPFSSKSMFRPNQVIGNWLESMAGYIAHIICLQTPPVNFYSIASRFLTELSLPLEKILPSACRIYEWLMPPELWLSAKTGRMPTRVCVMSILIVAMRILYNIHGFGMWERSLSGKKVPRGSNSDIESSKQDSMEIICHLEKIYYVLDDQLDFSKDLSSYLKYCSDVVFAGKKTSYEEENIAQHIRNFYADQEDTKPPTEESDPGCWCGKRLRDEELLKAVTEDSRKKARLEIKDTSSFDCEEKKEGDCNEKVCSKKMDNNPVHNEDEPLKKLKADMEKNWFQYIPPRKYDKKYSSKYLAYHRNKRNNMFYYVAHADYYILLRACAKVVKVDVKIMHRSVLKVEQRLSWIECHIDSTFQLKNYPSKREKSYNLEVDDPGEDDVLDFEDFKFRI